MYIYENSFCLTKCYVVLRLNYSWVHGRLLKIFMRNTINISILILSLLTVTSVNAQVIFSDNFDTYSIGPFNNGSGWSTQGIHNDVRIVSEPNRGNVLAWGWNTFPIGIYSFAIATQSFSPSSIENRDVGNDVFKLEFEFYCSDFTVNPAEEIQSVVGFGPLDFYFRCQTNATESKIDSEYMPHPIYQKNYKHSTWIKAEVYFEYSEILKEMEIHTYIPMLKYWNVRKRPTDTIGVGGMYIDFSVYKAIQSYSGALIKYDNIKFSAVSHRPAFANVNEWISSKFNVYPNPATKTVNIDNRENIQIDQVTVYDIGGKKLSEQTFNKKAEIELNVENLASGTYILHLKTAQGLAEKKLVKK